MIKIKKTSNRNPDFEKIAWDVFFQSKNRGISLERHFPWILESQYSGFYVLAENEGEIVGGLVVKKWQGYLGNRRIKVGLIGLVCVKPDSRGKGISDNLLEVALKQAKDDGVDALTLWTNFPSLYSRYGFFEGDAWSYGWVHNKYDISNNRKYERKKIKILELEGAPVPPFAESVHQLIGLGFSIFLVKDVTGWIVAGYSGNVRDAAQSMVENLSNKWRLNILKNDPLYNELNKLGCEIDVNPVNLQMWYCVDSKLIISDLVENLHIPVLDRI